MSIRRGATPIGRPNDDWSETGGRTSLDTCRARGARGEEFARAEPPRDRLEAMRTDVFIAAETSNAIHRRRDRR